MKNLGSYYYTCPFGRDKLHDGEAGFSDQPPRARKVKPMQTALGVFRRQHAPTQQPTQSRPADRDMKKLKPRQASKFFFLLPPHAPTQKATKRLFSWSNSLKWLGVEFVDCSLAIRNVQTEDVENYLKWLILAHFPNRNFLQGRPRSKMLNGSTWLMQIL